MADCRAQAAAAATSGGPVSRVAGAAIVLLWLALSALFALWAYEAFIAWR
jgi:hypothetical protein